MKLCGKNTNVCMYSAFQHTDNVHSNFSFVETSDIIKVSTVK